jgi:predicted DNA-binding transcriptional regulator YafY
VGGECGPRVFSACFGLGLGAKFRAMNRTDRLVAIVLHLQGRRVVRAEDLARRFEVSLRTVYRDMAALGEAGVPIAGEAGVGYWLVKGYHLPPVMLTAEEAGALFLGGEMVREFTDASLQEPSRSALEKLRAVLPAEQRTHVERVARSTVVTSWPRTRPSPPALGELQLAVVERRVVRIDYRPRDREEVTRRDIEPLGVIFYGGHWYLVAWCRLRTALRHFRLDRIQTLETKKDRFPVRSDFDLGAHLAAYDDPGPSFPARVWFADGAVPRARAESYATLVPAGRCRGGQEFTLFTWSYDWLLGWVASFGGEAELLEPAEVRARLHAEALTVAARHAPAPAKEGAAEPGG